MNELEDLFKLGTFYYKLSGLFIKLKVLDVNIVNDDYMIISLEGGSCIDVWTRNIKKVKRVSDVITKLEWCYKLFNEDSIEIGYIGKKVIK